jgi:hypothetical protein
VLTLTINGGTSDLTVTNQQAIKAASVGVS